MNKYLVPTLMITGLAAVGCGERTLDEIVDEVNVAGRMTDTQAESLSKGVILSLDGLKYRNE